MSLAYDIHTLDPGAKVDQFIVDLNPIGVGQTYYFYPGLGLDSAPVEYLGQTYLPWIVQVTGLDKRGTGAAPRPSATIANIDGFVTDLCRQYQDLVGAVVIRRRNLAQYVLANVANYRDEKYFIEQRASELREAVKFVLASPLDFNDFQLPAMIAVATSCPHRYKSTANGSGCSWPGTDSSKWFDRDGNPVGSAGLDVCGKRLSDCKLRFGANNPLDFGAEPALGRSGA
ncbi:phage minor tail protein L [Methylomonas sp. MED-D]|uniref:phage minor tail protein L n=1 Tax=Methylomonas sp. MED-D TaxID=3418768 RepID=UPI003D00BC37